MSAEILLSEPNKDALHPDIIQSKDDVWVTFEEYSPAENYQIKLVQLKDDRIHKVCKVTDHPAGSIFPSLALDHQQRLWIAFQSARHGDNGWDIPCWVYIHLLQGNHLIHFNDPDFPLKIGC